MGGLAFSQGEDALKTPRMPATLYSKLKEEYQEVLQEFYGKVACPHEVPNKPDHGDIDFLVEEPKRDSVREGLAVRLQAKRWIKNHPASSYAVPLSGTDDEYVQVDVQECPTGTLEWEVFMKSYGDLWQILGLMQRGLGLTANDRGLFIRVPEIEERNRKDSMLFLTRDPDEVMAFLRLDTKKWYGQGTAGQDAVGFTSVEDIFEWCTSGRFFTR